MTRTLPGVDIRGYYAALGIQLPPWAQTEASVRCFADPDAHRHSDRHTSCSVNLTTGAFNCHGCGAHGGAYDAAIHLRHDPRSAIELMICHGLTDRRRTPLCGHRAPRLHMRLPPDQRTALRIFDVSEDDVACWRRSLGVKPLIIQRLIRERVWDLSTIRAFELGLDRDRVTIPVRDADHQLVGLLRYQPWGPERATKMLAAPGSRRQLLPHPAAEPSRRIVLVEGEPDMLAARSHNLPAIAIPGVESWKSEWASALAGRNVAVALDCDEKGRAAAQRIAQDLRDFAQTRVLDLAPDRSDGFDLTDWLRTTPSLDLEQLR